MSSVPPRPRAGASTDYSSKDYWTARFEREQTFEWLTPSSSFLPHITRALDDFSSKPVRIIHIGCGNSEFSLDLRQLVEQLHVASNIETINVDYSAPVLERMQDAEIARFGDSIMEWRALDLLDWTSMGQHFPSPGNSIVVDKSCADAIACGPDVRTPLFAGGTKSVHPTEVLALHLAALTTPGSIWVAISYSTGRFDFLAPQDKQKYQACNFWQLERTERILSHTEARENVYAPEVYHTLFVLKRTSRTLEQMQG
ncbi:hypothetical protein FRC12_015096 [Ceratobasidium sp. 428]|nr:hypothetical protein FRC12_015096 [Ceratobasidium sp. 428]